MRDIAVVSYASAAVARDDEHNETETIVPVVREALAQSGLPKSDIGFVCSGSLDYLQGGPFAFVGGLDAVGAWPPIRESHVEMDGAWALYEAWVAIQTGEVDAALVQAIRTQGGTKIQDETALGVGANGYGTLTGGTAPTDTDRDGMPDAWETKRGLSPSSAADGNGDDDGDGYTNLEEYLNELAAPAFQF